MSKGGRVAVLPFLCARVQGALMSRSGRSTACARRTSIGEAGDRKRERRRGATPHQMRARGAPHIAACVPYFGTACRIVRCSTT